jgi:hypothetical protein
MKKLRILFTALYCVIILCNISTAFSFESIDKDRISKFVPTLNSMTFTAVKNMFLSNSLLDFEIAAIEESIHKESFDVYKTSKEYLVDKKKFVDCHIELFSPFYSGISSSEIGRLCMDINKATLAKFIITGCINPNKISNDENNTALFLYIKRMFKESIYSTLGRVDKFFDTTGPRLGIECHIRDTDIVKLLVDAGGDPGIKDLYGNTAISYLNEMKDDCYAFGTVCPHKDKAKLLLRILLGVN